VSGSRGEIDAKEQHDQEGADGAEHRNRNGGGAACDVPWAELTEQLADVEVLQQLLFVRGVQHLLREIGDTGRDTRRKLGNLLGDGRSCADEHCHKEEGDRHHHDGERGEMRKSRHPR
jgi:hypothetical protein